MMKDNNKQRGVVSLFVVIFAALLMTIVTVSFIRIMIQNQQQASATDLSQSAYDSAQAGVEDAKRAILRYQSMCSGGSTSCVSDSKINSTTCNEAVEQLIDVEQAKSESGNEIKVQTGTNSNTLDQAYTCVKINTVTDDYLGGLRQDSSRLIPLTGVGLFNKVKIEWFNARDMASSTDTTVDLTAVSSRPPLLAMGSWTSIAAPNRPSIMRTQLIQYKNSGFSLDDFDDTSANASNNTLFLYPSTITALTQHYFSGNVRRDYSTVNPRNAHCESITSGGYSCSATIGLPLPSSDHTQYLNLTSLYKKSNFKVTLLNGTSAVKFDGVQPSIDSTGRANDIFRRVQTRVELTDVNFPYPEAAIDITGNFCKDFFVTDNTDDYNKYMTHVNCSP